MVEEGVEAEAISSRKPEEEGKISKKWYDGL
jgi:hypothetical protein